MKTGKEKLAATLFLSLALLLLPAPLRAVEFMSVDELEPGMKGYGLSVFKGTKIEKFDVEILGVQKKVLAGQDMIMIRMAGMGLEHSGTVAGMSGSPIYIDGRLLGAVAYAATFQKDPIAGVTPITDMIKLLESPEQQEGAALPAAPGGEIMVGHPDLGPFELLPVPTPITLGGFTARGGEKVKGFLSSRGMIPMAAGGAAEETEHPEADDLQPGSAISVPMMTGDMRMTAVGTVTYREGDRILAFGHPFLNSGPSEMPMGGAVVYAVMPSYARSYKIAAPARIVGGLLSDRLPAIMGQYGIFHGLIPMTIEINNPDTGETEILKVEVIKNDLYTPMLLSWAAEDAMYRAIGELAGHGTLSIALDGSFEEHAKPFHFEDKQFHVFSPLSVGVLDHFIRIQDNKFKKIHVKNLKVSIEAERRVRLAEIQKITLSGKRFNPGDKVEINVHLRSYDGGEFVKTVSVKIPSDTAPGPLMVLVEGGEGLGTQSQVLPVNFEQFFERMMEWIPGNRISVRLVFRDKTAGVEGEELPTLPGSVEAVLQDGFSGEMQTIPHTIQELFPTEDIIRGKAQAQIIVKKEFGQ
ncbi:MAG: SpoIVB peptidase S55 domain-containing protein [bacterium]